MRIGILCNGEVESYEWLGAVLGELDGVICADGGANHAYRSKIKPLVIVGDLDSVEKAVLAHFAGLGVATKKFPAEKDETDLQLALKEAVALGATEVVLLAATGKRIDHTLGNISLLADLLAKGVKGVVLDEYNDIRLCEREAVVEGEVGEEVSLLPLTTRVTGVCTESLKYPLESGLFTIGNPYGISNVLTANTARVTFDQGLLLVIKSKDKNRVVKW